MPHPSSIHSRPPHAGGRPRLPVWMGLCGLFLLAATGCAASLADGEVQGADVLRYDVALRLAPQERTVEGCARIAVRRADTLTTLPLRFAELELQSVRVEGVPVQATRAGDLLRIPVEAAPDTAHVEVCYRGVPPEGLYTDRAGDAAVVYTDAWPYRGSGWLPAVHHPSDPAAFALTLEVPVGYEAAASGVPGAVDTLGRWVRYRWDLDTPAPTYTFAFAVADFSVTETVVGDTLPLRYYMLAADSALVTELARTPQMLACFSEQVGPYPFDQYATVEVPFSFAGMENASASFLQADLFRLGEAEEVQAHEAAHQWFGNRVVIADWRDLWLSEGMATYLTTLFYECADGLDVARRKWADMAMWPGWQGVTYRALVPRGAVDPDAHLTWIPYEKGGSVLHLLRLTIGDAAFFEVLQTTYARYAGRPLSTAAFQQLAEQVSGRDLEAFFDYWVYGEGLPTLHTTWDAEAGLLRWRITGDEGTLEEVPVQLLIHHGGRTQYVALHEGEVALPAGAAGPPEVMPVGVMMHVE